MKQLYTIIISLLILSSCSTSNDVVSNKKVQKRKYTKGFVVKKSDKKFFNNLSFKNVELHAKSDKIAEDKTDIFLATIDASVIEHKWNKPEFVNFDTKNLKKQKTTKAIKGLQLLRLKNHLKKSDSDTKTLFSLKKPKEKLNTNDGEPEPKVHWAALTGFITSLVGIFVSPILLGILSIIFGGIGLSNIKKNPEKYKGKGFGITALVLGIIEVVIIFLVVAVLLAAI